MALSGPVRALLILAVVGGVVGICLLVRASRGGMVARAEKALAEVCAATGLGPQAVEASAIKYFREYPSLGSPRRLAGGRFEGFHVEAMYVPIVKRHAEGQTMAGVECPRPLPIEVGLSARDAVTGAVSSLFGQPNGVGTRPLFGRYAGWGKPDDLQRVFSPDLQAAVLAFPRTLDLVMLYGQEVVLVWKPTEPDAGVVKQAFHLGIALCKAATAARD